MDRNNVVRCETCGWAVDHAKDAMVYCKVLRTRVGRNSLPCQSWTATKIF